MDPRLETFDAFRASIARLGLPLDDEEMQTAWSMARDLRDQADGLPGAILSLRGSRHMTAPVDESGRRRRG